MNVKDAVNYLRRFQIKVTPASLRAAIRSGEIPETYKKSNKDGIELPLPSIQEYALKKTNNKLAAYQIGYEQAVALYHDNVISHNSLVEKKSFLFQTIRDNRYHYLTTNFYHGYNSFYLELDNRVIHLLDMSLPGTSAINMANTNFILDILKKAGAYTNHEDLLRTILIIYVKAEESIFFFSCTDEKIGVFEFGTDNIEDTESMINSDFRKLIQQ